MKIKESFKKKGSECRRTKKEEACALAGNRTRVSRVAGENSSTEPPMLASSGTPLILLRKEMQNKESPPSCLAAPALNAGGHLVCALVFL